MSNSSAAARTAPDAPSPEATADRYVATWNETD